MCLVAALVTPTGAAAQSAVTVSGTVVDLDGNPLERWALFTGTTSPQFRALTDSAGRFQFSAAPSADQLLIDGPEWAFATASPVTFDDDVDLSLTVPLDDLDVLVVDDTGEPIVGRRVSLTATGEQVGGELALGFGPTVVGTSLLGNGSSAHTDTNGIVGLTAPVGDAMGTIKLWTGSADPWDAAVAQISLSRADPAVFVVPRLREVEVLVVGADGQPRPDVRIALTSDVSAGWIDVTGPDGMASATLGRGPYDVELTLGDLGVRSSGATLVVEEESPITLTLPPLVDWRPVVVDGHGEPVADTNLRLRVTGTDGPEIFPGSGPTESWQRITERTDASGSADLPVFEAGAYLNQLSIFPPPGSNLILPPDVSPTFTSEDCCTFVLQSFTGQVRLVGGDPLPGQTVELRPADDGASSDATGTDANGLYALTVDAGDYDVVVRSGTADVRLPDEFEVVHPDVTFFSGRTADVQLPVFDIDVSVVDQLGRPVDGAVVEGCGDVGARPPFIFVPSYSETYGDFCDGARSDDAGVAALKALSSPALAISVHDPTRPDLEQSTVEVRAVGASREVEVVLSPRILTPGAALVVEGDRGFTVVEVPIRLSSPAPESVQARWRVIGAPDQPGVATPWVDLAGQRGVVRFAKGSDTATIRVVVFGDTQVEAPLLWGEWGLIEFSDVRGPAVLDTETFFGHGLVVIVDDDTPAAP